MTAVRGRADFHLMAAGDVPVRIDNREMLNLGDHTYAVTLSDYRHGVEGVADLLARMIEALAEAPDLTEQERIAVVERLAKAVESVDHRPSVLPAVSFPARLEAEAAAMEAGR